MESTTHRNTFKVMKFRIIEIENSHYRTKYIPQYKKNWYTSWRDILANKKYIRSIFYRTVFNDRNNMSDKEYAEKIIEWFKQYNDSTHDRITIHQYPTAQKSEVKGVCLLCRIPLFNINRKKRNDIDAASLHVSNKTVKEFFDLASR